MISIDHPTGSSKFTIVRIGHIQLAFSYTTLVGIKTGGQWIVMENYWGPTTGKHLNYLDGGSKDTRIDVAQFSLEEAKIYDALGVFA